jgi:Leucine-rich repeat (LRR) protein
LEYLYLNKNKIASIKAGTFRDLKEMRYLDLSDNRIIIFDKIALDGLNDLKNLLICRNPIVEFFPTTTQNLCQSNPSCEITMDKNGCINSS